MITKIKDVIFSPHSISGGKQAILKFENGYGASIITGPLFHSTPDRPYEIAVLDNKGHLTYSTPVTEDVCGYLSEEMADEILKQIQELPKAIL
jgi:hypothetical protein